MHWGRVRDGVIVNVIVADDDTPDWRGYVALPDGVWIGWLYDGLTFTAPAMPPESETGDV